MGRPKSKKVKIPSFQFQIGEQSIYVGGLYSTYKNQIIEILEKHKIRYAEFYTIKFSNGIIINSIWGNALKKIENTEEETTIII